MLRHRTDLTKDIQTLMLTADPNLEKVKAVFEAGKCYEWVEGKTLIGIAVVHERDTKAEIMNLSVASQFEGQGYARKILDTLTKIYADEGYHYLSIGTGNSSLRQLKIYQKN
ncbi:GNAT family N-acetyltransferase [Staphylococcus schleiferi]|nr:GNAT family N-acetyltransferase [Staphylococcus schleiferi]UXR54884.1 GNAT family N-acetyltransferase [Staphylococcus schleiferi]UXR57193.1 GNAT family N-acetyltransferase [Staphylococcus schleiferi]UXR59478.1 GNAT family N-acetyltransferase [Staphylococcus schleiferi]UXR61790.1 GNAT family N-acetyltransferase [Staphylococcus schleiferi]